MVLLLPVFLLGFPVMPDFSDQLKNYLEEHRHALERNRPVGGEESGKIPFGGLVLAVSKTSPDQHDGVLIT